MTKFTDAVNKQIKKENKYTRSENMGKQYATTKSDLLDLFSTIGAMRNSGKTELEIEESFVKAFTENPLLAVRTAFYARNIRDGGLGERDVFKVIIRWLANNKPQIVIDNIEKIPEFGRWDDLFVLFGTPAQKEMVYLVAEQLDADKRAMENHKPISLLAKWMPSVNTSSKETRNLAKKFVKALGVSEAEYRKTLSKLRAYSNVVEVDMSAKNWDEIVYESVPSKAMTLYRSAFARNDNERFSEYLRDVKTGVKEIKTSTLYPYDIVRAYANKNPLYYNFEIKKADNVLEAQWKALPNYVEGENNILVMADTSGSMFADYGNYSVPPIYVSLSLAVYFAERNHGAFKDLFLTFSSKPRYVKLDGSTLATRLSNIPRIVENTDIEKAFKLVLKTAIDNDLSQEDLPKALVVISDMEFDSATYTNKTAMKNAKKLFKDNGYELPMVVFWNVAQRTKGAQARMNDDGVILVSGSSAGTFRELIQNLSTTPYGFMLEVLNKEPYTSIVVRE